MVDAVHSPLEGPAGHVTASGPQLGRLPAGGEAVRVGGVGEASHHVLAEDRILGSIAAHHPGLPQSPGLDGLVISH